MTKDPVCSTQVKQQLAEERKLTSDFDGQTFYFCSSECKKTFDAKPHEFAPTIRWPEDWESQDTEQAEI